MATARREHWIAEAAYYRALQRGFAGGDPVTDWLAAEVEIDSILRARSEEEASMSTEQKPVPGPEQRREELAAYEKLRERVKKLLGEVRETVTADTLRKAVDQGSKDLREVGKHTADTVSRVADALKKDMASAMHRMGPQWESFSDKSADLFEVWRDRGSAFLAHAATATGRWLEEFGSRLEHPIYRTGDMTGGGEFECTACGTRLVMEHAGHLPPCRECQKTEFRHL